MLTYPSIPTYKRSGHLGEQCIAFEKYDGSNLRFEWAPKRNWYKFGTRHQLFDENTEPYNQGLDIFLDHLGFKIEEIVCNDLHRVPERIVAFAEMFGNSSFAGSHNPHEAKALVLFDVSVYKKGFYGPNEFVKLFGHIPHCARVVYKGPMDSAFIQDVRMADMSGQTKYLLNEGVICKGDGWSSKIKTLSYLERLKKKYGAEWEKFE